MNEVTRQEKKYLLSMQQRKKFETQLDALLPQDRNNEPKGFYVVRSLYFDTMGERDYLEKEDGVEFRRKIRLRLYSVKAPTALLEMKQKQGSNQLKRSLTIKMEDAKMIAKGEYESLLSYNNDFALECYALMMRDTYRPRTIVEYRRKAYLVPENSIRITLDGEIRALEGHMGEFFEENPPLYPVLEPWKTILEVKYNHFLLSYVKDIIRSCNQSELSMSKYIMARKITLGRTD